MAQARTNVDLLSAFNRVSAITQEFLKEAAMLVTESCFRLLMRSEAELQAVLKY